MMPAPLSESLGREQRQRVNPMAAPVCRMPGRESEDERPPCNLDAERAVLGAVLLDNSRISVFKTVSPEDFFLRQHKIIAHTVLALRDKNTPSDLVTLNEELEQKGVLEEAGGTPYVSQLIDGIPSVFNVEYYAQIVRGKAVLREVAYGAEALMLAALEPGVGLPELETKLQVLTERLSRSPHFRLKSVTSEQLFELEVAPREMVLAPIFPTQGLGMLYSKRGLGKTYLGLGMAHAVASGDKFLQWTAPEARTARTGSR
jgi:hypothetical protein